MKRQSKTLQSTAHNPNDPHNASSPGRRTEANRIHPPWARYPRDHDRKYLHEPSRGEAFPQPRASAHAMPSTVPIREHIVSIDYPEEGKLRARKVISRSKTRPTMKYPSWKMRRMIHCESVHELNASRLLDADPSVVSFREQPLVIRFVLDGQERLHYPDFLVDFGSKRELWEVKTDAEAVEPEVYARTQLLQAELPNHGYTYRLVLAEDVAREPRLSNVLTLLRFGRQPIRLVAHECVRRLLQGTKGVSWAEAQEVFGRDGSHFLSRLFLEGFVTCDLEQDLTPATRFWYVQSTEDR